MSTTYAPGDICRQIVQDGPDSPGGPVLITSVIGSELLPDGRTLEQYTGCVFAPGQVPQPIDYFGVVVGEATQAPAPTVQEAPAAAVEDASVPVDQGASTGDAQPAAEDALPPEQPATA